MYCSSIGQRRMILAVQIQRQVLLASPEGRTGHWRGREVLGAIGAVLRLYFGAWDVDSPKVDYRAHLSAMEAAEIDALLMGPTRT